MNNQSIEKLRVDRRLHRRRGWISDKALQQALDALPDVSDKILPADEEPEQVASEAPEVEDVQAVAPGAPVAPEGGGV